MKRFGRIIEDSSWNINSSCEGFKSWISDPYQCRNDTGQVCIDVTTHRKPDAQVKQRWKRARKLWALEGIRPLKKTTTNHLPLRNKRDQTASRFMPRSVSISRYKAVQRKLSFLCQELLRKKARKQTKANHMLIYPYSDFKFCSRTDPILANFSITKKASATTYSIKTVIGLNCKFHMNPIRLSNWRMGERWGKTNCCSFITKNPTQGIKDVHQHDKIYIIIFVSFIFFISKFKFLINF